MAVTGARLAWCAETDRYAAAVLARHWPDVPNLGDVTALDWAQVPPVDLVSAGWPCQDISYAGPGAGITEGTRSGLWLIIAAGLHHLQPSYVFLENVAALRTRGLGKVLGDLAALGYDTQWLCLRAADAGAPHRRDRLLLLAVRPGTAARLAAAADPGHRVLAERTRPAGRPARQRAPKRPGPRRQGHGPDLRAGRGHPSGCVGGVRAGDPLLGGRPGVPGAAAC
jgi:DNA (cytosine-5)-methyltransferase 1